MTVGIIAGRGRLPQQLAEACQSAGRECFILALEGITDFPALTNFPHAIVRVGAVGTALEKLRAAQVREIVLAGAMRRPSLTSLAPDMAGAKLLTRLGAAFFGGDDKLLKAVIAFFEDEGFTVIGPEQVFSGLVAPLGNVGKFAPDAKHKADIALGMKAAKMLGALDIGQAVVVENGYVLGLEAAEGTEALIARCASLAHEKGRGVLVKAKKPGQDARADLPAVGPHTVKQAHASGLGGIAVEASASLILDRDLTVAMADTLGLFLVGVTHE